MTLTKAERSKVSKRSKARGSTFERKIAKMFTDTFTDSPFAFVFHKVPASGGLRWKNASNTIGDIVTPENFRLVIECKKHADIDYEVLFLERGKNKSSDLISFWHQSCEEATRAKREPLLVVEKRQGKPIAILPRRVFEDMADWEACKNVVIKARIMLDKEVNRGCWHRVVLLPLNKFLEHCVLDKMFVKESK